MSLLRSMLFAFSMFSRLPVPTLKWRDDNMRYLLAMFPFVGAAVGLAVFGWVRLSEALGFGVFLRAAGISLLPVAVTGGIHLDGFCDTSDALASRLPPEKKRAILKDPHAGSFAVIAAACYVLLFFALAAELDTGDAGVLAPTFVLSRALSGLAVLLFAPAAPEGTLRSFRDSADRKASIAILGAVFVLAAAAAVAMSPLKGAAAVVTALVCLLYLRVMSYRQFGGMSGDLAGFFLQVCEIVMLAAIVVVGRVAEQ